MTLRSRFSALAAAGTLIAACSSGFPTANNSSLPSAHGLDAHVRKNTGGGTGPGCPGYCIVIRIADFTMASQGSNCSYNPAAHAVTGSGCVDVTGLNRTVVVGSHVRLLATLNEPNPPALQSPSWSGITTSANSFSEAVTAEPTVSPPAGYTVGGPDGSRNPTYLSSPNGGHNNPTYNYIEFNWVKPGSYPVTINANYGGVALSPATVTYTVVAPTVNPSTDLTTKTYACPANPTVPCQNGNVIGQAGANNVIQFGNLPGVGIRWNYGATPPVNGAGLTAMVQTLDLVLSEERILGGGAVAIVTGGTCGATELDDSSPYWVTPPPLVAASAGTRTLLSQTDSPSEELPDADLQVTVADTFVDYFLYRPNDASANSPSVWVTLGKLGWTWSASASQPRPGTAWTFTPGEPQGIGPAAPPRGSRRMPTQHGLAF